MKGPKGIGKTQYSTGLRRPPPEGVSGARGGERSQSAKDAASRGVHKEPRPQEGKAFRTLRPEDPDPRHYDPIAEVEHCASLMERAYQLAAKRDATFVERILRIAYRVDAAIGFDREATLAAVHLDFRRPYPIHHSLQKAIWAALLVRLRGDEEDVRVETTAAALTANVSILKLQHDLEHQDEALSDDQLSRMRRHPEMSAQLLETLGVEYELWLRVVRQHHERLDGSGYPEGLSGDDVDVRALAVAFGDAFSAMITPRGYRKTVSPTQALAELGRESGSVYPAEFVQRVLSALGVYVPGTLVRLDDGSTGIVIRRGEDPKKPKVVTLITALGQRIFKPVTVDTASQYTPFLERALPVDAVDLPMNLSLIYGYTSDLGM